VVRARRDLGIDLSEEGKVDEAIAMFRRGLEIDPRDAVLRQNLGYTFSLQGKLQEALAELVVAEKLFDEEDSEWARDGSAEVRRRIDEVRSMMDRSAEPDGDKP